MKEKEFIRFYIVDGKIDWDRIFKDTLLVLYGDEVNNFVEISEIGDFIRLSDNSILLCEIVKNRIDPDDAV
jgi:hypothetical protein